MVEKGKGGGEGGELVIQGSDMVSGTRCPAWSDQLNRVGPVRHEGEFPGV